MFHASFSLVGLLIVGTMASGAGATLISNLNLLFETFNPLSMVRFFEFNDKGWNISSGCIQDMFLYLDGLHKDTRWAVKCKSVLLLFFIERHFCLNLIPFFFYFNCKKYNLLNKRDGKCSQCVQLFTLAKILLLCVMRFFFFSFRCNFCVNSLQTVYN